MFADQDSKVTDLLGLKAAGESERVGKYEVTQNPFKVSQLSIEAYCKCRNCKRGFLPNLPEETDMPG